MELSEARQHLVSSFEQNQDLELALSKTKRDSSHGGASFPDLVLRNAQQENQIQRLVKANQELSLKIGLLGKELKSAENEIYREKKDTSVLKQNLDENENQKMNLIEKLGEMERKLELEESEKAMLKDKIIVYEKELNEIYLKKKTEEKDTREDLAKDRKVLNDQMKVLRNEKMEFEEVKDNLKERLLYAESRMLNLERVILKEKELRKKYEEENKHLRDIKMVNEKLIAKSNILENELMNRRKRVRSRSISQSRKSDSKSRHRRQLSVHNIVKDHRRSASMSKPTRKRSLRKSFEDSNVVRFEPEDTKRKNSRSKKEGRDDKIREEYLEGARMTRAKEKEERYNKFKEENKKIFDVDELAKFAHRAARAKTAEKKRQYKSDMITRIKGIEDLEERNEKSKHTIFDPTDPLRIESERINLEMPYVSLEIARKSHTFNLRELREAPKKKKKRKKSKAKSKRVKRKGSKMVKSLKQENEILRRILQSEEDQLRKGLKNVRRQIDRFPE